MGPDGRENLKIFNLKEMLNTKSTSKTPTVKKYEYASFQGIGERDCQQDCLFISNPDEGFDVDRNGLLLAVADGMGGMDSGDKFSGAICDSIKEYYKDRSIDIGTSDDPEKMYIQGMLESIKTNITELKKDEEIGDGGSTLCLVHLYDGEMSYLSVGDSRIYLLRNEVLHRVNEIHNLGSKYLKKLADKEIEWDDYRKAPGKEGLTSYIGEEDLSEVDLKTHIKLIPGDIIMIFSDGVFGTLSDEEIKAIAVKRNVVDAAYMFEKAVDSIMKEHQDNFTGIIVRCFE